MTYGLLHVLWGNQVEQVSKLQKKSIRLITGSEYLAHSKPLFKEMELLKIEDLYKLKILKFNMVAVEYHNQHHDPFIHHRHGIVDLNFTSLL